MKACVNNIILVIYIIYDIYLVNIFRLFDNTEFIALLLLWKILKINNSSFISNITRKIRNHFQVRIFILKKFTICGSLFIM